MSIIVFICFQDDIIILIILERNFKLSKINRHYIWPDLFKTTGILLVILQHSWEETINYPINSVRLSLFYGTLSTFGRAGVPLFIMITGYFALKKDFSSNVSLKSYWYRKIPHFFLTSALWILILWLVSGRCTKHLADLLNILFIGPFKGVFTQFWYVALAIMLWLILPLLAISKHHLSYINKRITILIMFLPFIYCTIDTTNNQFHWLTNININSSNSIPMAFICFISTAGLGFFLVNAFLTNKIGKVKLLTFSILSMIIGYITNLWFVINHFKFSNSMPLVDWYSNIWNLIFSIGLASLLLLISKTNFAKLLSKVLEFLAKYSMAVFFCHYLFVIQTKSILWPILPHHLSIQLTSIWICSIIISYLFVWIIKWIPFFGKILVDD